MFSIGYKSISIFNFLFCIPLFYLISCNQQPPLFTKLDALTTGVGFSNTLTESDSMNIFTYEYIYNGGGVGIGDFNNDGLQDIFFTGSMVSNKLYLNKGNFKFEDITDIAGIKPSKWCSGVSMVDINKDGLLDVHVCTVYPDSSKKTPNLFYINTGVDARGIPHFEEKAAEMGLNDSAFSTQAAFFDYDHDGDMDMYLCTNSGKESDRNALRGQYIDGRGLAQDKLYRNEGINPSSGLPVFSNVSKQAGIQTDGWGLGLIVKDINGDGWQDIYVANDFQSNDHLYINNHDGTFTNKIGTYLKHQCHNAMGVDMADFNNDGLEDFCVVDMMPDDNLRQKTMFGAIENDKYNDALRMGYQPQFVRNVLQLNNGPLPGKSGGDVSFSDIGYMAGVAATDWSWSALFADFDLDGNKDLLITNGYVKDITNLDFVNFMNESSLFGARGSKQESMRKKAAEMGQVKKRNWLFKNNGDLTFTDKAKEWGLTDLSFSNGAAYADLDNDGDLDIVINNLNDPALIYRNNCRANIPSDTVNSLVIQLSGANGNGIGTGTKISVWCKGKMQYSEHCTQRGYLSNVDSRMFFGTGKNKMVDSLEATWVSGKRQLIKNITCNRVLVINEKDAVLTALPLPSVAPVLLTDVTASYNLNTYVQEENDYLDFNYQYSLPHRYSTQGPAIAVADVNGDGLEDAYIGGASRHSGYILLQTSHGFDVKPMLKSAQQKLSEETGVLLFDADNDGDNDLYCVAGGNEFGDSATYQDLFFLNDGKGNFKASAIALPNTTASGSVVVAADIDHDGDLDLFVGGRIKPHAYPLSSRSYLLRNDTDPLTKQVKFTDITLQTCKALMQPGMVSCAIFTDYDNDGFADLFLAGEFMPLQLYKNNNGKNFELMKIPAFQNTEGWYNSIASGDFDNDGDMDYVAGNLGLNSRYKANMQQPITVRYNDFDNNGSMDAFLFGYNAGKEYPLQTRTVVTEQIPSLKKRMLFFHKYGEMGYKDMFNEQEREKASTLQAFQMQSVYIENKGGNVFVVSPLPKAAQVAPMFGITVADADADGNLDIISIGNSYAPEALTGRYDASNGWFLKGNGLGGFSPVSMSQSGLAVMGDGKSMVKLNYHQTNCVLLATQNSGPLKAYDIATVKRCIPLLPGETFAIIHLKNGKHRREEFFRGSSYLSQSGRFINIDSSIQSLQLFSADGKTRDVGL